MAFNFHPSSAKPVPIDYSWISDLPKLFEQGAERGREAGLRDALSKGLPTLPDGSIDWAKAASIVGQYDPGLGMRTAAYAQQNTMDPYQKAMVGIRQQEADQPPEAVRAAKVFAENPELEAHNPNRRPKTLYQGQIDKLTKAGEAYFKGEELATTFDDNYAGYGTEIIGKAANWAGRNVPGVDSKGAEWWQNYNRQKNVDKNTIFGSALTGSERADFEAADINPGMKPEVIRANLKRQNEAKRRAAVKLGRVQTRQKYDAQAVDDALGFSVDEMEANTTPPEVAPATQPNELDVQSAPIQDPRGAYFPGAGQPQGMNRARAPEGMRITNGEKTLEMRNGEWVEVQ